MEFTYITPKTPKALEQWIRLVFPVRCIICDAVMPQDASLLVCENCLGVLELEEPRWQPSFDWPEIDAWYSPFAYAGGIEHAIRQMKYHNLPNHSESLACILAEALLRMGEIDETFSGIIPVPMHPSKVRARGYNQAVLLAKTLSEYVDIPVYEQAVKKTIRRHAQNGLTREERFQVLKDSFSPISGGEVPKETNILLVDDVLTTGSTLRSCALAIIEAYHSIGIPRENVHIYALCVAYA